MIWSMSDSLSTPSDNLTYKYCFRIIKTIINFKRGKPKKKMFSYKYLTVSEQTILYIL